MTLDDVDGEPIWPYGENAPMPGGFLSWDRLAVGKRCETWVVWSPSLWSPAVLKLARPHMVTHPRAALALTREVRALHDNPHPVLPRLYASDVAGPVPFIALEYVDGPTLADEIDDNGKLVETDVAILGLQLLTGLRALHGRGLAHVDVKPDNIVLRDRRPVLVDFGQARELGATQPAGRPVGTPGYAAPEMEACEPIGTGMDVYGLGIALREALTGDPPVQGVPPAPVHDVIDRLCAASPGDRPGLAEAYVLLRGMLPEDARPWPSWAVPTGAVVGDR
ncbi:serine/threonine protein kinase [Actinoplanes sp. TBRC 11911]|uniref:serine/threonine protein kinase n=1 Tax=Actinoplanes sp. TBRC 11911 TaxID=2729386 RepID=UPI00145C7FD1|nr:serine/threonine-protein kinase [Actinoplanes sp. TBRC 11911]NMO55731.1 serine/threonine protein kinase [Actinoplanes sp. TBRC 11911]